jgi:hypothetical protein
MTTEFGSSAYLNMMHDLNLIIWQRVGLSVSVPVKVEDIEPFRYEVKIYEGAFYGRMPKESFNGINISSLV